MENSGKLIQVNAVTVLSGERKLTWSEETAERQENIIKLLDRSPVRETSIVLNILFICSKIVLIHGLIKSLAIKEFS